MLITYFDEVKFQEGKQPYYWIGGIVVTPEMVWNLEKLVSKLSCECFSEGTLSKDTEFHAKEIFHRKGNFKGWENIEKRMSVLLSLVDILNSEPNIGRIYVRIDPAKMISENNIEEKAFMFFVEKVERYLRDQNQPGMLIGDRDNERVSKQFAETLSHYRAHGTPYLFGIQLTHLIDTVHFTNSHHSRMLQLADLYVWLLQFNSNTKQNKHPHFVVIEHVRQKTNILIPTKYKIWPTDQSWYNFTD
ncbi:DUF3800 domain-containing protein [Prosthecochloris sp. SCSIO W1102]|uniref:DUF3800 domain-containing protein n=1 Tax=Prosthecochloris sp. SCSIO W1102 TaxID=2992243 RepID=UPI00223CEC13|nr:DUF3800 domain-containing protein [Prosthecochloris sp. SCSIO W1102]UZJ39987.1 DUF3800 domain-containing protein [Prosthecochloris sp. SCSIO W1102]